MGIFLLGVVVAVNLVLLVLVVGLFRHVKSSAQLTDIKQLAEQASKVHESLSQRFTAATADMAMRLYSVKVGHG
jgi:Xaa-Pro aminopeptidase